MNRYLAAPIVHCIFFGLLLPGATFGQDVTRAEDLIDQLEIKPEKEPQIRTRGIVINVPDANQGRASFNTIQFEYDFVIEGHADAHGDDQYNKELSFRRATTVKEFLVMESGVTEQRLEVVGFGEERPKTDDPFDAENRRVDVVNVKAGQ
jgi:hypothetical protein